MFTYLNAFQFILIHSLFLYYLKAINFISYPYLNNYLHTLTYSYFIDP
jgi:hypothetical protein